MTLGQLNVHATVLLQGALLVVLGSYLARFRWQLPWLGALLLYFAVREVQSIRFLLHARGHGSAAGLTDAVMFGATAMLLVALILTSGRMLAGLRAMQDAAAYREEECRRALRDYEQLVRHRLFNPLTVIAGAAQTVRADVVDDVTRDQLLEAIVTATEQMREATLEPVAVSSEEHSLRAQPRPLVRHA